MLQIQPTPRALVSQRNPTKRQLVDTSDPAYMRVEKAGSEQSTNSRWWDFELHP